ncbi:MAG: very short patch repair endonuclease [Gammaproteobacteria bacterium]|nr:very short patch repair endonuclease [Gammaproteobacteria bacterium]MCW5582948.1 very short patch repair endonuclease [Gammaproteobacteria bacterium]
MTTSAPQALKKKDPRAPKTTPERSYIMSRIRSRGNKSTELAMLFILREHKIKGWRRHLPLQGNPDFCFPKNRLVIFVDGCFWHGCPKCYRMPKKNVAFWTDKVKRNILRDKKNNRMLRKDNWTVLRIWEHSLSNTKIIADRVKKALIKSL